MPQNEKLVIPRLGRICGLEVAADDVDWLLAGHNLGKVVVDLR